MKYYKMIYNGNDAQDKRHIGCQEIFNNSMPDYTVCTGEYVAQWDSNITFVCNDTNENMVADWLSNPLGWCVVSKRFVNTVADLENGAIQYLPIKIKTVHKQMCAEEYFVANVITVLDAIDYTNSLCFELMKNRSVIKYALKNDIISGNHIFKVKEDIMSKSTFVSADFKKAIQKAGLFGFSFTEVKVV